MSDEQVKIRPRFFGDDLWFVPAMMLSIQGGLVFMFYRLAGWGTGLIGLSIITAILIQPWLLFVFIHNLCNRVIFKQDRLILRGFFWKKTIEYSNIKEIMVGVTWPVICWFDPKKSKVQCRQLFIWRYSIQPLITEVYKRTGLAESVLADALKPAARRNRNAKIIFVLAMAITFFCIGIAFPKSPSFKSEVPYCETRYRTGLSDNDGFSIVESVRLMFSSGKNDFSTDSDIYVYVTTPTTEPRCNGIRIELSNGDGKVLDSRNFDIVPAANKEWKLGNFNEDHNLAKGEYSISIFASEKLVKKFDFSVQ